MFYITLPVKLQDNNRENVNDAHLGTLIRRLMNNCKLFHERLRKDPVLSELRVIAGKFMG